MGLEDGGEGDGEGQPRTVVVGVELDSPSRTLLTWALCNVAQSGDRVIALHVIDTPTESTSALISLANQFNSMLSVYEIVCKLREVDLKLKLIKGLKARKILVREAKSHGEATLIVGVSKPRLGIRPSASLAKYCASKLPKNFSVFAVHNGKVWFHRLPKNAGRVNLDKGHQFQVEFSSGLKKMTTLKKNCSTCTLDNSGTQSGEELTGDGDGDDGDVNLLAMVPYQSAEAVGSSSSVVILDEPPELKSGWSILRRVFLPNQQYVEKPVKKTSVFQWVLRLPSWHSSAVVYPDQKQSNLDKDDERRCSSLDGETGAIVPFESSAVCPLSPCNGLGNLPKELLGLHEKYSSTCRLFNYQELLLATSNFKPENMVGKGGSSNVYKGCLPDGKELAVKILKPSEDVVKDFIQEIDIITTLHHKNIISLFGFCFENNNLLLVYDFLSRGSLEDNLHGNKKDGKAFGWQERYNVAVGVAEALEFLHNGCVEPVIHRDVKSSNILLSDDFEPQLSDFGLAGWASTSSHVTCTDVAGTFGCRANTPFCGSYLAPEYFMHGKMSDKIDVYAFGVVLLELLSGRKPINGKDSLVMWAKPILKGGEVSKLLDPSLGSDYDHVQIERMVLAATLCIKRAPRLRPQISIVLKLLQGDEEATRWAKQPCTSEEVDDLDGEAFPTNLQSYLNLALLGLEDDSLSSSGSEQSVSLDDYLHGRWSRSSSFD
ncbi:receptor-like cytosolic serine/threonine-protein kinase rbk2 [Quercus suber]|uniref:Receptor-like cytosolic serine/threonine-protein kinase rbk2 n=1 Tax=Quercus suber TaxID=58331 RepID=A0AAW0JXU8_QUESU